MGPLLVFLLSLEDRSEVGGLTPISLVLQALGQLKIYRGIVNSTGMLGLMNTIIWRYSDSVNVLDI
jgi:hypothetical protein